MASNWKVRASLKDGVTTVKALISHPMETGIRKDKKTGKVIPAHFIEELTVEHKGKNILTCLWGPAVSTNPYLSFSFKGAAAGDTLKMAWVDNKGNKDATDVPVK